MGRSKGAAARRRKADAARKANASKINVAEAPKINVAKPPRPCPRLVPDVLANIHDRLGFLDRVAFAAVFAASCDDDLFNTHAPWLLLPSNDNPATVELFSIADRRGATVPEPAMRDHMAVGSNRGWLATAHARGQMYLVNPATGEQHELPHLSTMGVFHPRPYGHYFTLKVDPFLTIRYGHGPPFFEHHDWRNTFTWSSDMTRSCMYRKVVLSSSPSPRTYAAMLISSRDFGAPAFASAEDPIPTWRLAPSPDGVEDAIHHDGQFYSVSHAGLVEAWERDAESGAYTSTAVAPRLDVEEQPPCRKYLAAAPGGRLMVVMKYTEQSQDEWSCSFKVHVLCDDGEWKETRDVGDLALFVGMNNSLCVPTIGRPEMEAGCVYYTDDLIEASSSERWYRSSSLRAVGVYSLVDGTVKKIEALQRDQRSFDPLPVWITPSIP